ncbi:MAG: hypothetical protein CMJ65_07115 [Planctomycetaceae bacterium]|jgi:predicted TIM-barrel fold metal-dependent hydrolase|nr:hypothetical protein [Planctomycetaceae bacterium]MDP7277105.1 amidohydrolase family protein [Planctomycetaceae bacterium]
MLDIHTHVFCWGENPEQGFLSEQTRRRWLTRLIVRLTGLNREPGETRSEQIRNRLIRQLDESRLQRAVVLAQDAVYRDDGQPDLSRTHFYVSNDYVLELAGRHEKILPGCSINPVREDALEELERCALAGGRLVKVHTAIQGVDPSLPRFDAFYRLAAQLDVTLMFHTGYEHSCQVISQAFTDPRRLARPLEHGLRVIAAHCGTCAFFDREDYYPGFVEMMHAYENLYGDTSILATWPRRRALARLAAEPESLRRRLLHGSDFPFPPARIPYLHRIGFSAAGSGNPLDVDLAIKRSFDLGPDYATRGLQWLEPDSSVETVEAAAVCARMAAPWDG